MFPRPCCTGNPATITPCTCACRCDYCDIGRVSIATMLFQQCNIVHACMYACMYTYMTGCMYQHIPAHRRGPRREGSRLNQQGGCSSSFQRQGIGAKVVWDNGSSPCSPYTHTMYKPTRKYVSTCIYVHVYVYVHTIKHFVYIYIYMYIQA